MILSLALTQFVFVSLGILTVNVLLKAGGYAGNVAATFPPLSVWMATHGPWFFAVPLAWVAFAALCLHFRSGLFTETTARFTGIVLTGALFAVYFYASFLLL